MKRGGMALLCAALLLVTSARAVEERSFIFSWGMQVKPSLHCKSPITAERFALPQRSPKPRRVPCTPAVSGPFWNRCLDGRTFLG